MKNRIGASALGVCLLAASTLASAGPANAAAGVDATLRVVTYDGKILADRNVSTAATKVKSSTKANCFGPGSSNASTTLAGPTALGLLGDASKTTPALRPLSITNALGFGLGVCGIGGSTASNEEWWFLKVNHRGASVGGDQAVVSNGDTVLWYLARSYNEPNPTELYLKLPDGARKNVPVRARVLAYDDKGRGKPVEGARLSNVKAALTDSKGYTTVKFSKTVSTLARASGSIPSNRAKVSVRG